MSKEKANLPWIADYNISIIGIFIQDFKYIGQMNESLQTPVSFGLNLAILCFPCAACFCFRNTELSLTKCPFWSGLLGSYCQMRTLASA